MFLSSSSQVNKASYFQGLQVTFFCPIRVYSSNGFALVSVGILLKLVNDRVTRHLLDSVSSTNSGSTIYVSSAFFEKSEFPDRLNERWVETATAMRTRQTDTKPPTTTSICETTGFESQKKKFFHTLLVSQEPVLIWQEGLQLNQLLLVSGNPGIIFHFSRDLFWTYYGGSY